VGSLVGVEEGVNVGFDDDEGFDEGILVGSFVGVEEGVDVGFDDGSNVGLLVGWLLGENEGNFDG
jgi:hypothetical protein